MTKVCVLLGGRSGEREVSLRSGAAVAKALREAGYEVVEVDPSYEPEKFKQQIFGADVVFPALHGAGGEDGELQGHCEEAGMPCVGSGKAASELCMDKWRYKQLITEHGLSHTEGELVDAASVRESAFAHSPFVLKPNDGGSSLDTFIVRNIATTPWQEIDEALTRYPQMLLEKLVDGQEMTVGILNDKALTAIEIVPPSGDEFNYENKYNGKTQELCPPEHIAAGIQETGQQLALRAHQLTGCRGFSRTDMMIDKAGMLYITETNTIPGLTEQSLFPKAAAASGISMPELVDILVKEALTT